MKLPDRYRIVKEGMHKEDSVERSHAVAMRGKGASLVGPEIKAGDRAPGFTVLDRKLGAVSGGN